MADENRQGQVEPVYGGRLQGVFLFSGTETEHTILTARKKHGKMSKIQKLSEKWSRDRGKKYEV